VAVRNGWGNDGLAFGIFKTKLTIGNTKTKYRAWARAVNKQCTGNNGDRDVSLVQTNCPAVI